MNEQPKKTYTLEDNVKSLYFGQKDILKAIQELKDLVESLKSDKQPFWDLMLIALIFAHVIDIHLPTSHDFGREYEYDKDRANKEAEETLQDPDASAQDKADALDQLFGPTGNHAW